MDVQIWRSFSCNNSSDYRLVARFGDAKTAAKMADELTTFFEAYAKKMDAYLEEHDYDFPDEPIPFFAEWAKKLGVKAKGDPLTWGDEGHVGDEPNVAVTGNTVAIYHTYCGGFGSDLPAILKKAGAKVEAEDRIAPDLACTFQLPPGKAGEKLAAELVAFLDQGKQYKQICDFEIEPPWGDDQKLTYEDGASVKWASDGVTFAFTMPFDLRGFDALKAYLAKHKCAEVAISLCDRDAIKAIDKLAAAAKPTAAVTSAPATQGIDPVGKKFLFTGKLAVMSRDDAKRRVKELGGIIAGSVSKDLDFLVVGDDGSPLYGGGAKGDKMIAAEKLIAKGAALQIISENAFLSIGRASATATAPATKPVAAKKVAAKKVAAAQPTAGKAAAKIDPAGKRFLFTGKLKSMTRDGAKQRVLALGGIPAGSVSKDLDYLVIGDDGSPLFGAGTKGDKMIAAEKLIAKGAALRIISETDFLAIPD